jgi:ChrR-like protein with cupin domain
MNYLHKLPILVSLLVGAAACGSDDDSTDMTQTPEVPDGIDMEGLSTKTELDLADVKANPDAYDWFDFRPNVLKLILSGAAETEHVAILWYTVTDGAVGLHYHSKTESVYVIDGTQTDAKGVYPTGTVYFNPPGSGHQIMNSSGFFVLAYASPPDFMSTDLIGEYTPVRIDTADPDLMSGYPLVEDEPGMRAFDVPLDSEGGMSGKFIELTSGDLEYRYEGNYVLVLEGSCDIEGKAFGAQMLVVAKELAPEAFDVAATEGSSCLAMGVSF